VFLRPSSRVSSVTPSPTPSTRSARPLLLSTSSMPSSARVALCTVSVVKSAIFRGLFSRSWVAFFFLFLMGSAYGRENFGRLEIL